LQKISFLGLSTQTETIELKMHKKENWCTC
jgi:hypothetical protein